MSGALDDNCLKATTKAPRFERAQNTTASPAIKLKRPEVTMSGRD